MQTGEAHPGVVPMASQRHPQRCWGPEDWRTLCYFRWQHQQPWRAPTAWVEPLRQDTASWAAWTGVGAAESVSQLQAIHLQYSVLGHQRAPQKAELLQAWRVMRTRTGGL